MIDYVSSISLSRMLYGQNLAEWIAVNRPTITTERQYGASIVLPLSDSPIMHQFLMVKAPMGSGKTTALIKWLKTTLQPNMSVLVVSCRRTFTYSLSKRFNDAGLPGFTTYFTSTDYIIRGEKFKRLFIQAESLHRVDKCLLDQYDILILDEIMSTISQLYSTTMRRVRQVDNALTNLMRRCPQVIAMDATINSQFVDAVCQLRGENNVHVIIGEYVTDGFSERKCILLSKLGACELAENLQVSKPNQQSFNELEFLNPQNSYQSCAEALPKSSLIQSEITRDTFCYELKRRLKGGLNICIFSSTLIFSELIASYCRTITESVLLLNSDRKEDVDISEWSSYRVVIYTTVVTVGLNFDTPYFHSMFAYVKPTNYGPDMVSVYQSLGRVRTLLLNELFLYIDGSSSRDDQIFTPMLLNHVVANKGNGWPTSFSQVTGAACCGFRHTCKLSFPEAEELFIYKKFKYKYLFERCTLSSFGDSVNILHCLLEGNYIDVSFGGYNKYNLITADTFSEFLREIRVDAKWSQKYLKEARLLLIHNNTAEHLTRPDREQEARLIIASLYDNDAVNAFIHKYIRIGTSRDAVYKILILMRDQTFRNKFTNTAVLEACLAIPSDMRVDETIDHAYETYGVGQIPFLTENGCIEIIETYKDFNIASRRNAYRSCALVLDALNWGPTDKQTSTCADITPEIIHSIVRDYWECFRISLMEITRQYATGKKLALSVPARNISATLNGSLGSTETVNRTLSKSDRNKKTLRIPEMRNDSCSYSIALLKVVLQEMFGARLVKSTRTFPGATKVKNLRKAEIEALLDHVGINRTGLGTYKELYSTLMANKDAFFYKRYRIKRPRWYSWLKPAREIQEQTLFHYD